MARPTDCGYVVITNNGDGTSTVEIAAMVVNGIAQGVYAAHIGVATVVVDPGVGMQTNGTVSQSADVVQVFMDADTHILRVAPVTPVTVSA